MEKSRYCDICEETNCTKDGGVPDMGYLKPDCYKCSYYYGEIDQCMFDEKDVPDNFEKKCEQENMEACNMSIKLENVVLASPEQMMFIIQGLRNPMNSHDRSDSKADPDDIGTCDEFILGENDHSLMQRLANAGTDHRKYMRMMPVYVRITAPLYWWKEFDTYKVGTVANSCSTMHKIAEKEFTLEDFSTDQLSVIVGEDIKLLDIYEDDDLQYYKHRVDLTDTIHELNFMRRLYLAADKKLKINNLTEAERKHIKAQKKKFWWQMIQLLPSSYNQTRNVMMNYEVLANIYKSRKNHRLDEWRELCSWIESLPYSELITGAAGSLEARRIFNEPFPWTKEVGERLKAETEGIIKVAVDKELRKTIIPDSSPNSFSMKDLEEAMKHFDPNNGVKTHVTMIKED